MSPVGMIQGMPVHVSPEAVEVTTRPVRIHKRRPSQSHQYHWRVQKKWNKRFGFVTRPTCYIVANRTMVMHPDFYARMKQEGIL